MNPPPSNGDPSTRPVTLYPCPTCKGCLTCGGYHFVTSDVLRDVETRRTSDPDASARRCFVTMAKYRDPMLSLDDARERWGELSEHEKHGWRLVSVAGGTR